MNTLILKKLREAKLVIERCAGEEEFYAGDNYRDYWTRDLVYSLDGILESGYEDLVKSHLLKI